MLAAFLFATALLTAPCRSDVKPPAGYECAEVQPAPIAEISATATPVINPGNVLPGPWFTPTGARE